MKIQNVVAPLAVLSAVAIVKTVVGYHSYFNADARGWWPAILLMGLYIHIGYSLLFGLIAGNRVLPVAYVMGFNGVLAAIHAAIDYLYFTHPINWAAVNTGAVQLTTLQTILHSGWTSYTMFVAALITHFIAVRIGRLGRATPAAPAQKT